MWNKLYLNPRACLLNHKGKFWTMRHLFASIDYFPIHHQPPAYSMDILFYSIFPMNYSFMSLLLFSNPQGVSTWFWGRFLLHHLISHSTAFSISHFPLWVSKQSFNNYFISDSSQYFNYSIIIIHYIHFDFIVKIFTKITKYSK